MGGQARLADYKTREVTKAELDRLHGVTPGVAAAGKAVVLNDSGQIDTLDIGVIISNGVPLNLVPSTTLPRTPTVHDCSNGNPYNVVGALPGDFALMQYGDYKLFFTPDGYTWFLISYTPFTPSI